VNKNRRKFQEFQQKTVGHASGGSILQHSVFVRLNLLIYHGMNINPHGT